MNRNKIAFVIFNNDDVVYAAKLAKKIRPNKVFFTDPHVMELGISHKIKNSVLLQSPNWIPNIELEIRSRYIAITTEKILDSKLSMEFSLLGWQYLNLWHLFKSIFYYEQFWAATIPKLEKYELHIFANDHPGEFQFPSFIPPAILLKKIILKSNIKHTIHSVHSREDASQVVPDFRGHSPGAELLIHLPTIFHDARFIEREIDKSNKSTITLRAKIWETDIKHQEQILSEAASRLDPNYLDKNIYIMIYDVFKNILKEYLPKEYLEKQSIFLTRLYLAQIDLLEQLNIFFKKSYPKKILLSDHDAGYHGPVLEFASRNSIPILLFPHSKVLEDTIFNKKEIISVSHPIQVNKPVCYTGAHIKTMQIEYPKSTPNIFTQSSTITTICIFLNGIYMNGMPFVDINNYMIGLNTLINYLVANKVSVIIRMKPNFGFKEQLKWLTNVQISDGPLDELYQNKIDLCIMYDIPSTVILSAFSKKIPVVNILISELSSFSDIKICNTHLFDSFNMKEGLDEISKLLKNPNEFNELKLRQIDCYENAFVGSHALHTLL